MYTTDTFCTRCGVRAATMFSRPRRCPQCRERDRLEAMPEDDRDVAAFRAAMKRLGGRPAGEDTS